MIIMYDLEDNYLCEFKNYKEIFKRGGDDLLNFGCVLKIR